MPVRGGLSQPRWTDKTFALADSSPAWVEAGVEPGKLAVYWRPRVGKDNRYPSGYNVYRGITPDMAPNSPGVLKLNTAPVAVPMFLDDDVDTRSKAHWYYLVAEIVDGVEYALGRPTSLWRRIGGSTDPKLMSPFRIFTEMKRRNWIVLRNDGEQFDVLVRLRAGRRCECYAPEYESTLKSQCPLCFGVGWAGGYQLMRSVLVRYIPVSDALKLQPQGLILDSRPRFWHVDFPLLRNGDVLVRRTGERYEADSCEYNVKQGVLVSTDGALAILPETHPIYAYQIPASDEPPA